MIRWIFVNVDIYMHQLDVLKVVWDILVHQDKPPQCDKPYLSDSVSPLPYRDLR